MNSSTLIIPDQVEFRFLCQFQIITAVVIINSVLQCCSLKVIAQCWYLPTVLQLQIILSTLSRLATLLQAEPASLSPRRDICQHVAGS